MTIDNPQNRAPGTTDHSPRREGHEATEKVNDAGRTKDAEPETEEEKIRREQATKPALMPIGDPAGAA